MSALVHEEEGFSNNADGGCIAPSLIKSRLRVLIRSKIVYDADFDDEKFVMHVFHKYTVVRIIIT